MNSDSANSNDINSCILIAESLNSNYQHDAVPLRLKQKFADFNSANVLDFSLNWLADNKLKECFVLYSKSKKSVEEYFG